MRVRRSGFVSSHLAAIFFLIGAVGAGWPAAAGEPLAKPTGPTILTVSGEIGRTNAPGKAEFDRQMLEALGVSTVTTSTSWTDGQPVFTGVLVSKVLDAVEAKGSKISAIALDDYAIDIAIGELRQYSAILALTMNGAAMSPQDKGPIWIVYPRDDHPELRNPKTDMHWVWQLKSIDVKE